MTYLVKKTVENLNGIILHDLQKRELKLMSMVEQGPNERKLFWPWTFFFIFPLSCYVDYFLVFVGCRSEKGRNMLTGQCGHKG
jgi:hypothetical protein